MGDGAESFRVASPEEAHALMELERDANLVALAHVFPAAEHPYPEAEVEARWDATLAEDGVTVEVVPGTEGLLALVAYDDHRLRHLAVHPSAWGRGLARSAVERAVTRMAPGPRLWCLDANHRARGLYEHLGWRPTGGSRRAEWPPHPVESEYALARPADGQVAAGP
ncbi:GNAT family N-acetyltransferase [Nocardioides euryhalodurans]|uniref:GNAT family N-acetyltransferase n=1 Tax=Nocardioides euryhalodurans TaxID=2518370 RepID=A0A4P7GPP1_9ACTN|nr:GNAT family N-acetyltransferase [Nocardioides euryhalodurans]QBR94216.1 GNAT family N-acetyltransferase [Nocardioides euryhalodurans]